MISKAGDEVWKEYNKIHMWIRRNHGSANHCSNLECKKTSDNFQWSLIPGKNHEKNIENYKPLCIPCHRELDITTEWRVSVAKALKDVPKSEEHKEKISEGMLEYWRLKKLR